jgi:hypothetical protein
MNEGVQLSRSSVRGLRNNNPLNIRKGNNWKGERPNQTDKAFEEFVSIEWGIRAGFKLMRNHITGFAGTRPKMNTLRKLIGVWAPMTENATDRYINIVAAHVHMLPSDTIDPKNESQMVKIARAMAFVECGVWIDESYFRSAWALL